MRRRPDRTTSDRNAAALRRLAIIGAQLADDRGDGGPDAPPEMGDGGGVPRPLPEAGPHLGSSAPPRSPLLGDVHDRLPASVQSRLGGAGLTAHHVVVVTAVIAVFVALGAWWFVSSRPSEVTPVSQVETSGPPAGESSTGPATGGDDASAAPTDAAASPAGGKVVVDVTGKVRDPGIVSLRAGSRVADAIKAAGGAVGNRVDLSTVNLARVLVDGEQIIVGMPAVEGAAPPVDGTTTPDTAPTTTVNLNTATLEQLDTLPGVGPVTGQAILDWRTEHGRFGSVDELLEVDGIGEVTLEELRELVTV